MPLNGATAAMPNRPVLSGPPCVVALDMSPSFNALTELLTMLLMDVRMSALLLLLLLAAIIDWRSYRIPNWLTLSGAVIALTYSVWSPSAQGPGFWWALGGLALGLALMLPFHLMGVMGAGDVKLMAMAGAFLGLSSTGPAVLFVFIAGGLAALLHTLVRGTWLALLTNLTVLAEHTFRTSGGAADKVRPSVGKLPYGVSIWAGTTTYVLAQQLGYV